MIILDTDLKVISANKSFYRTFKVNEKETINRLIYNLGNKQWDIPELRILLEKILPKKKVFNDFEVRHKFPVIGEKTMLLNARQLDSQQRILLAVEDVTERRKKEQITREIEEQFRATTFYNRSLIETSTDPFVTINSKGKIMDANKSAAKIRGVTKKELIGSNFSEYFTEPEKAQEVYRRAFAKGSVSDYPLTIRSKNGKMIHLLYNTRVYKNNKGNVLGVFAEARDITNLKKAEEDLEKNHRLLEESEKIGKVGGWEFNIDTMKLKWTNETYNIHEVDPSFKPTIENGVNFYTPASKPIIAQAVQRAIDHGDPFDVELEIITAKGNLRSVHAIGEVDLKNRRVYGFFQDITRQKKEEEAIQKHNQELEKLNKIMVGRELKMIELKQEITRLKSLLAQKQTDEKIPPA